MKPKEIREMSDDALFAKGAELREQLFRLRFKQALGNTDTVRQTQVARKDLARVKTELRERERRAEQEAGTLKPRHMPRADRKRKTAARRSVEGRAGATR